MIRLTWLKHLWERAFQREGTARAKAQRRTRAGAVHAKAQRHTGAGAVLANSQRCTGAGAVHAKVQRHTRAGAARAYGCVQHKQEIGLRGRPAQYCERP